MNAADLMTKSPRTVLPGTKLSRVLRLMLDNRISGLPVTEMSGRMLGIVTEGDLLRRSELGTERTRPGWLRLLRGPGREAADYTRTHSRKVDDVMTTEVVCADETTPAEEIVRLMEQHHVKRIPIVRDGILVGIVSRADLLRALFASLLEEETAETKPVDDETIRRNLQTTIDTLPWAPRAALQITVDHGNVELSGVINDDRERWALIVAAENVPGVRQVTDKLVAVEPSTGMVIPNA